MLSFIAIVIFSAINNLLISILIRRLLINFVNSIELTKLIIGSWLCLIVMHRYVHYCLVQSAGPSPVQFSLERVGSFAYVPKGTSTIY